MKKNIIIVTGGAGFVGTNLIKNLLKFKKYKIISIDNYSTGKKVNQINDPRVKYIKSDTKKISQILKKEKSKIDCVFHFGEFARIFQSFLKLEECLESNLNGTKCVINFCLENKIKLIYSATSATLGNNGQDKNLSPYAFIKATNLEYLENLKKWFNFKYEVIYFYNVYGPHQICKGDMATVIGIFQEQYLKNQNLTVVKPGSQSRKFTYIDDTIKICLEAWKKDKNRHYSISAKESYKIIEVAKMFSSKIIFIPKRSGERYNSAIVNKNLKNKIYNKIGKTKLVDYIKKFKTTVKSENLN